MTDDTDTTDDGSGAPPGDPPADGDDSTHADAAADVEADGGHGTGTVPEEAAGEAAGDDGGSAVREYLLKGALVMLVVLGVVTTLQFYFHAQSAIGRLVSTDYRPLFLAGFNLVVLLAVGIGIAQVVRRLG